MLWALTFRLQSSIRCTGSSASQDSPRRLNWSTWSRLALWGVKLAGVSESTSHRKARADRGVSRVGRKNRRAVSEPRPASGSSTVTESHPDGEWNVRKLTGSSATKTYRCPGCDHEIRPATPHVVAWPADTAQGAEERRHWHTPCWKNRGTRGSGRRS